MADPYTDVSIANYNQNPPADDGSQVPSNEIGWDKHKTKLADPLKTAIESINTNVGSAVDKLAGGVTAVSDDYTVLAGDQGKLIVQSGASKTHTLLAAATAGQPFGHGHLNAHATADLTIDGNASETIDGATTITVPAGRGVWLETDGSNWFTRGQNWLDTEYTRRPIAGGFRNLAITVASNTAVNISADAVTLENSVGESYRALSVSQVSGELAFGSVGANGLDTGTESADTWYFVWLIYNPTTDTVAGLLSISATSPTLPSGYTFYALIGAVRNDASSNLYRTLQKGKRLQYVVGTNPATVLEMVTGTSGSTTVPTWTAVALAAFVPTDIAATIIVSLGGEFDFNDTEAMAAPNNSYGAFNSDTNRPPLVAGVTTDASETMTMAIMGEFLLESTNLYYASNEANAALSVVGCTLNL